MRDGNDAARGYRLPLKCNACMSLILGDLRTRFLLSQALLPCGAIFSTRGKAILYGRVLPSNESASRASRFAILNRRRTVATFARAPLARLAATGEANRAENFLASIARFVRDDAALAERDLLFAC